MTRFVDQTKLKQIDLGDGDWVKVPERIAYKVTEQFAESKLEGTKRVAFMLRTLIKEWNLKDGEGNIPDITEENIYKLDIPTINLLAEQMLGLLGLDVEEKKKDSKEIVEDSPKSD